MIAGIADTPTAIWFLSGDPRLSATAKQFFYTAAAARRKVALSSISLAELAYLIGKDRLPASADDDLAAALANPSHILAEAPFTAAIVEAMRQVPRAEVPDVPDRIVAATAIYLGVPLITRDERLRASTVPTIW